MVCELFAELFDRSGCGTVGVRSWLNNHIPNKIITEPSKRPCTTDASIPLPHRDLSKCSSKVVLSLLWIGACTSADTSTVVSFWSKALNLLRPPHIFGGLFDLCIRPTSLGIMSNGSSGASASNVRRVHLVSSMSRSSSQPCNSSLWTLLGSLSNGSSGASTSKVHLVSSTRSSSQPCNSSSIMWLCGDDRRDAIGIYS